MQLTTNYHKIGKSYRKFIQKTTPIIYFVKVRHVQPRHILITLYKIRFVCISRKIIKTCFRIGVLKQPKCKVTFVDFNYQIIYLLLSMILVNNVLSYIAYNAILGIHLSNQITVLFENSMLVDKLQLTLNQGKYINVGTRL